jgi:hypothetical protein
VVKLAINYFGACDAAYTPYKKLRVFVVKLAINYFGACALLTHPTKNCFSISPLKQRLTYTTFKPVDLPR